jgi:hypothetical protein
MDRQPSRALLRREAHGKVKLDTWDKANSYRKGQGRRCRIELNIVRRAKGKRTTRSLIGAVGVTDGFVEAPRNGYENPVSV